MFSQIVEGYINKRDSNDSIGNRKPESMMHWIKWTWFPLQKVIKIGQGRQFF